MNESPTPRRPPGRPPRPARRAPPRPRRPTATSSPAASPSTSSTGSCAGSPGGASASGAPVSCGCVVARAASGAPPRSTCSPTTTSSTSSLPGARPSGSATSASPAAASCALGRQVEPFTIDELPDADKPDVLRAYLRRWKMEVGVFFDGVDASASDESLLGIAPGYPVFRVMV